MEAERIDKLKSISHEVQKDILRMVGLAKSGPFEMSMSAAKLLVYLYWDELLLSPQTPERNDRDRVVMNIPEAVPALYAVLARRGYFEREHLWHYRRLGSMLQALPDFRRTPGIDAPCVTVQPALALASSLAAALKKGPDSPRVIFITSDKAFLSKEFKDEAARTSKPACSGLIMIIVTKDTSCGLNGPELGGYAEYLKRSGWYTSCANSEDIASLEKAFAGFEQMDGAPKALFVSASAALGISVTDTGNTNIPHALSLGELDKALEELEVQSHEKEQ